MADEGILMKALEKVVDIDVSVLQERVGTLRAKFPDATSKQLARKAFKRAVWQSTMTGIVTSFPGNPFTAVPAAVADVALVLRAEAVATGMVALIYEPDFFDDEVACWELLVPVFGINVASQLAREMALKGGSTLTKQAIRKYLSKETLKQFKRIMIKYFGVKVTQKGVATKTVPVVGGAIGGVWNNVEVKLVRKRAIRYFEGQPLKYKA